MKTFVFIIGFILLLSTCYALNNMIIAKNDATIDKKDNFLLLVTGCSRSGTRYISKVLSLAGLDFRHEILA